MEVTIVGGGIGGLATALALHQRGIRCRIYEAVPQLQAVGVGITVLPHLARELTALGLADAIRRVAVPMRESCFFNGFGQLIYRDPAPADAEQYFIHRGDLQVVLADAVRERLGDDALVLGHRCVTFGSIGDRVTLQFVDTEGRPLAPVSTDCVIACDGVNSAVRRQLYPHEGAPRYSGINMWRGVTWHAPILSGGTHVRAGALDTGKMVIYPIRTSPDGTRQLLNWVAEIRTPTYEPNDWNRPGRLDDFLPAFAGWQFDWLDVARLITTAEQIFEYPMCDRDPLPRWTFGRVTLLGDAAHPMYPRGSNGAAQAIIDARCIARELAAHADPAAAFTAYEALRREPTTRIVLTNRSSPPDILIETVHARIGHRPFDRIEDVISHEELAELLDNYKRIAGYHPEALGGR